MLSYATKKDRASWDNLGSKIRVSGVQCPDREKRNAPQSILRHFTVSGNGRAWVESRNRSTRECSAIGAHSRHRGTWAFRSRAVDMVMQNGLRADLDAPKTLNKCSVAKQNTEQKIHWIGVQWEKFAYLIENQFSTGSIFPRGRARARAHV